MRHFFAILVCIMSSVSSLAEDVFVAETKVSGLESFESEAIQQLAEAAVIESERHRLVSSRDQASSVIQLGVKRLGSRIIVVGTKRVEGKYVGSSRLKAKSADELDVVISRVVESLLDDVEVGSTLELGSVTVGESDLNVQLREGRGRIGLAFGPSVGTSPVGATSALATWKLTYSWEVGNLAVGVGCTLAAGSGQNDDSRWSSLGLGMTRFFSRRDFSPFVGAALGYGSAGVPTFRFAETENTDHSGFVLSTWGGVELLRTSSVGFQVQGGVDVLLDADGKANPVMAGAQVGVKF